MLVPITRGLARTGKIMFCKPSCFLHINTNCCWSANMEGKAKESENRRLTVPSIFTVLSITLHLLTISVIAFGAYYVSTKSEIIDIRLAEVTDENRQLKGQIEGLSEVWSLRRQIFRYTSTVTKYPGYGTLYVHKTFPNGMYNSYLNVIPVK